MSVHWGRLQSLRIKVLSVLKQLMKVYEQRFSVHVSAPSFKPQSVKEGLLCSISEAKPHLDRMTQSAKAGKQHMEKY